MTPQAPWTFHYLDNRIDGVVGTVCHFHPDPEQQPTWDDGVLMAAAPELLAVLEAAMPTLEVSCGDLEVLRAARAVLAKARPRQG